MSVPASIQTCVIAIKTANATLNALVGTRFYQDELPQEKGFPCVKFQVISRPRNAYVFAPVPSQLSKPRIQFDGYVQSVRSGGTVTRETLASAIRGAFDRYHGTIGGKTVQDVFIADEDEDLVAVDTSTEADHVRIDFTFHFGGES